MVGDLFPLHPSDVVNDSGYMNIFPVFVCEFISYIVQCGIAHHAVSILYKRNTLNMVVIHTQV